uniref:ATP-dependent RNA helicase n=1 Tax=Panagrellus redivivus TaxID=6233 RepID=A0A7E4VIG3_PANRE
MAKTKKESTKTAAPTPESPTDKLLPEIREYFAKDLGFDSFTPVQRCTVKYFLDNYDCIVQAPTGSGKTLAYVLPFLHILKTKVEEYKEGDKPKIAGLILVPTRELVHQVGTVMKAGAARIGFELLPLAACNTSKRSQEEKKFKKNCIVISTPGRFVNLLNKLPELKTYLKSLEMLIIDEADRFVDVDFKDQTTKILESLPKQRRTGLFSATQAKEIEDLIKFGLRNPVRLEVNSGTTRVMEDIDDDEGSAKAANVAPASLKNSYAIVPAAHKLLALVDFLKKRKDKKVLVFFSSRFSVIYFERVLKLVLGGKRPILNLYGKKFSRAKVISSFGGHNNTIMLATDVAGRGLDLENVDAVVQFDIPKHSSWFVHRSGRAGRNNHIGESILLLTPAEEAYAEFLLTHEKVAIERTHIFDKVLNDANADVLRQKITSKASEEREFLELGTSAFVAMLNAYLSHDCQIVCRVKDLDIGALGNAYGLVRLPKFAETKTANVKAFKRVDIETSKIPYLDATREAERQKKLKSQEGTKKPRQTSTPAGQRRGKNVTKTPIPDENAGEDGSELKKTAPKRKKKLSEWEELQSEDRLLKKFKKGKINRQEMEAAIDDL